MCLIFISYNCSPRHRFVVAANRDEFRSRPTEPLGYLNPQKTIVGGRDIQAGGMWLGVSKSGKIAAVTNFRDGIVSREGQPSRGAIVYDFLSSNRSAVSAVDDLAQIAHKYAGFNVLFGDQEQLVYFSNRQNLKQVLKPGFYGLSNHLLDSPWPKVERGKRLLKHHMCMSEHIDTDIITTLLRDNVVPQDELLPDTGVGLQLERFLGSIFIDGKDYGTLSSAVVEVGKNGDVIFSETSYIHGAGGHANCLQLRFGCGEG